MTRLIYLFECYYYCDSERERHCDIGIDDMPRNKSGQIKSSKYAGIQSDTNIAYSDLEIQNRTIEITTLEFKYQTAQNFVKIIL